VRSGSITTLSSDVCACSISLPLIVDRRHEDPADLCDSSSVLANRSVLFNCGRARNPSAISRSAFEKRDQPTLRIHRRQIGCVMIASQSRT